MKYFTSCRDHTDVNTMDRVSRSPTNSTNAYYEEFPFVQAYGGTESNG